MTAIALDSPVPNSRKTKAIFSSDGSSPPACLTSVVQTIASERVARDPGRQPGRAAAAHRAGDAGNRGGAHLERTVLTAATAVATVAGEDDAGSGRT